MSFPLSIPLGAPGIYPYPDTPARALSGIRLDVCAFAGIAPRGPVRVPVVDEKWPDNRPCVEPERPRRRSVAIPVESFDEYRRLYGGFEGPGLLPYAVASFFEQGGRRAWIVRIVHDYSNTTDNAAGVATGTLTETQTAAPLFALLARSEGSWGNGLRAAISFTTRPLIFVAATTTQLTLDQSNAIPPGTLLRLTLSNGEQVLRLITTLVNQDHPAAPGFSLLAVLDTAIAGTIDAAEIVEGTLLIDDGDGRRERHERLGFASGHPRWIANVLCYESQLVYPDAGWIDGAIIPTDPILAAGPWSAPFSGGSDRYADIIPQDFFDNQWVLADGEPGDGVRALTQLSDLSLLMVPDLYSPAPLVAQENIIEPVSLAGPDFARCFDLPPVTLQGDRIFDLAGLRLDPKLPDERAKIIALQQQLTALADLLRSFIVLLDVPPGLNQRQILDWRASFASAFAAAYHPWLQVSRRDDSRNALIHIPPSAVAAGIIARQEIAFGVPQGPANVIAAAIVNVADQVSPARHDELHPQGINVYLRERDGIRLSAARTLSRDPTLRQLSVRRLLTLLARTLEQQMQWTVFEPNNSALRSELRLLLRSFLRQLFRRGAFRGATEDQAFFVRCDDSNNPPFISDAGRLIAEIGVAPAEPLEFIVLRLAREGDGTLIVQEK